MIANFAYSHWSKVYPVVQRRIVAKEKQFMEDLASMDATATAVMKKEGTDSAKLLSMLTNFTVAHGDQLVDDWNAFFGELFVRFSDGFDATATPRAPPAPGIHASYTPGGTASVDVKENGYDQAWYDRIVADAGEKYRVPDSVSDLIDPRLSTDRLQFM
jgi:hypothetical protein